MIKQSLLIGRDDEVKYAKMFDIKGKLKHSSQIHILSYINYNIFEQIIQILLKKMIVNSVYDNFYLFIYF